MEPGLFAERAPHLFDLETLCAQMNTIEGILSSPSGLVIDSVQGMFCERLDWRAGWNGVERAAHPAFQSKSCALADTAV
jgi:hypothetical protein